MYRKNNGFSKRPHKLQLLSYVFIISQIVVYWLIIYWYLSSILRILGSLAFVTCNIFVIVSWFITSKIDPSDDVSIQEKKAKLSGISDGGQVSDFYCDLCDTHVSEDTKHCKQCNRCVIAFDHHCKWVNNCIGRKNYKPFIAMIVAVLCFELVFTSLSVIIMLQQSPDGENFASMIVVYISTLLSFTLLILDTNLVLFHIWLIHHGITTYDYIVRNREKKKMKTEPKIEDLEDKEEGRRFFKDATKGTEISPKVSPGIQEREGQSLIVPEVPEIPKSLISQATFNSATPNELRQTLSPEQRNHDATTTLNSIGRSKLEPLQKFPKYNLNKMTEFVVERDLMCEVSDGQGLATPTKKAVPAPKKSDFVQRELVTKKFEIKSIANPTFKNTNITPIEQSLHAEKEPEQTNLIMSPLNKTEGSIENNVGSLDTIRKAKFFTSENQ